MATKINTDKLIVIVGPTASGKTSLAIKLAKKFNGEIISADSVTIRRDLNIGSAKPTKYEQQNIKHHLIDIIGPNDTFSAAQFKQLALRSIEDIQKRNKVPILVGGSGLYIDGVIYNFSFIKSDPNLRSKLNKKSNENLVKMIDKKKFGNSGLDLQNRRRLIRYIESKGISPQKQPLRENTLLIGLNPDRNTQIENISKRVDSMLDNGLEKEVKQLKNIYGWESEALKNINYSQWNKYFEGDIDLQKMKENLIRANYYLVKKQVTWFKRNKSIHWFDTPVNWTDIVDIISTFLNNLTNI